MKSHPIMGSGRAGLFVIEAIVVPPWKVAPDDPARFHLRIGRKKGRIDIDLGRGAKEGDTRSEQSIGLIGGKCGGSSSMPSESLPICPGAIAAEWGNRAWIKPMWKWRDLDN